MNLMNFKLFESFYYNGKNSLHTLNNSIRNLIINLRVHNTFKFKYLIEQFKIDLDNYKKELCVNPYDNDLNPSTIFNSLKNDIDNNLLSQLKIDILFENIVDVISNHDGVENVQMSINYIFDFYTENIDKYVANLSRYFLKNITKSKGYSPLKGISLNDSGISFNDYRKQKYLLQIELNKLHQWIISNKKKVLIIIDGRDAAGKSSDIKTIAENLNVKHCRVVKFDIPTEEEKNNWFQRFEKQLPKEGEMVFFDRSWYNRAIIEPAMGWCTDEQYSDFYKNVESFENRIKNSGVDIIKIWLSINSDTQKVRFELRKTNPLKYWKYSDADKQIESNFDKLTPYINKMLKETNFKGINWKVIDANDKKLSRLLSLYYILDRFNYDYKNTEIFKKLYS